jgi:hypothetical protein
LLSVVGVEAGVISRDDSRLVISVTVLSLALSPLWVFTARRLRLLAQYGVTEAGELMRMVYGPEAEMVAVTFDGAMSETQRSRRRIALFLRRHRLRRKRAKELRNAAPQVASVMSEAEPPPPTALDSQAAEPENRASASDSGRTRPPGGQEKEKPVAPAKPAAKKSVAKPKQGSEPNSKVKPSQKQKPDSKSKEKPAQKPKPGATPKPKASPKSAG